MLDNQELSTLRELRVKLLHYWQKFPEESLIDKKSLNDYQNILDKVILREQTLTRKMESLNEKV